MPNVLNPLSGRFDFKGVGYVHKDRAPATTDHDGYDIPTIWVHDQLDQAWLLVGKNSATQTSVWVEIGSTAFDFYDSVLSIANCTAAPPTEVLGDRYIVDNTAGTVNAAWDGASKNDIAEFDGTVWVSTTPSKGGLTYVEDVGYLYVFTGTVWSAITAAVPDATTAAKGIGYLATDAQSIDGSLTTNYFINPGSLKAKLGTQTNHGVLVGSGDTAAITALTVGTNGQVLLGSTSADPVFGTLASLNGSITYALGAGTLGLTVTQAGEAQLGGAEIATAAETTAGTSDTVIVTPSKLTTKLGTQTAHGVAIGASTSANLAWTAAGTAGQPLLSGGASADPNWGTLSVSYGGTGATTLTDHGILVGSGTAAIDALATGNAGQIMRSAGSGADPDWTTWTIAATTAQGDMPYSSAANTMSMLTKDANATRYISNTGTDNNPAWAQVNLANGVTGTLPVGNGGTGVATITQYALVYGNAAAAISSLGPLIDGQLVIGSTGVAPAAATLTAGGGISITNGAGSITIAATGSGMPWTEVTGTSQAMAINNAYIANNVALVTLTLPDIAAVGSIVQIQGKGTGLFRVAQNAGETIHFGNQSTTSGVGGSLTTTHRYDSLELVCITDSTDWAVLSAVGNITVA